MDGHVCVLVFETRSNERLTFLMILDIAVYRCVESCVWSRNLTSDWQASEGLFDRLNYDNRCQTRECGDYDRDLCIFFCFYLTPRYQKSTFASIT